MNPVRAAQHRRRRFVNRPCGAEARRPVVAIGVVAGARQAAGANRLERAGLRVVSVARSSTSTGGDVRSYRKPAERVTFGRTR